MDQTTAVALVTALLSVVVNITTTVVKQEKWPNSVNFFIAVVLSALGAVVVEVWTGGLSHLNAQTDYVAIFMTIVGLSQVFYHAVYKGTVDPALTNILANLAALTKAPPHVP